MTVTSDLKDLLSNAISVCTPLPRSRALQGDGKFKLSQHDVVPVRVTVWGATSPGAATVQYDCLETVADLRRFAHFQVRWQNDGVSVSTDVDHVRFNDGVLTGYAKGVTIREGRTHRWSDNARFGVTFADHYITTPREIKEHLERALHSPAL